jgi:amino acid transporter
MVCTRNLFAWSVDRVLPDAVTNVDRRFHTPWVATLIIVAAAEILLALFVFTSIFDNVSNYIVLFSVAFWMASWAAILLPYRRPEMFAAAPAYVQRRIGNVPVITVLGALNLVLFTMVLYSAFKLPAFSGPTGTGAVLFVVGIYLAGVVIYFAAKAIQRRRGIDLDLLYREIPPE